jgi:hypothetical protein
MEFKFTPSNVNQAEALIYRWTITDGKGNVKGLYIGKAKGGAERPLKHYRRNVNRLLAGKPYRLGNPEGFRKSHRALAAAVQAGYSIELSLVCNIAEGESIDFVERQQIVAHGCCGEAEWQLNG